MDDLQWIKQRASQISNETKLATKAPQKQKGKGGFLSSLISEGGALSGGVAGGSLGSALGPIGTLVGGAIGAGVGAFGGRLAENKIRDNEFRPGEALKEGAISAVLGASPIKASKGLLAAGKASLAGAEKGAVKLAAEKAILKPGVISQIIGKGKGALGKSATRLEARATGLGVGEKIGAGKLTPQESERLLKVAVNEGLPFGHPDTKAKFITDKLDEVGSAIDKSITKANKAIPDKQRLAVVNGFADRVEKNIALRGDATAEKIADRLKTNLSELNTYKEAVQGKRDLQKLINYTRSSGATTPKTEAVFKEAEDVLDDLIGRANSEVKTLNKRYSDLSKIQEGALNASKKLSDSSEAGSGSIFSKLISGDTAQTAKSGVGRAGMNLSSGVDDIMAKSFALENPAGLASRIVASKGLTSTGLDPDQEEPTPEQLNMQETDTGEPAFTPDEYDPYAPENLRASVDKIAQQGGSRKDIAEFLGIAKSLNDLGAKAPVKKTEGQRARDEAAQLTEEALAQLEAGSIDTGLIPSKVEGVKEFFGKGDQETLNFNTTISSLKAAIAKARAGTSFTPNEEKMLDRYAPSVGDTGQKLRTKLLALQRVYQAAAEREYGTEYQPDEAVTLGIE